MSTTMKVYPRKGASVTVNYTSVPVYGIDVSFPFSTEVANCFRRGDLVLADPYDNNSPQLCGSMDPPQNSTFTSIPHMLHIAQGSFFDPVTLAAQSQTMGENFAAFYAPPQDFAQVAADNATMSSFPSYNVSTWFNCYFANAVAREKTALTTWLKAYNAAGGRQPAHVAIDQENTPGWYGIADRGGEANAKAIYDTIPYFQQHFGFATYDLWKASLGFVPGLYFFMSWHNAAMACFSKALDEAYTDTLQTYWPGIEVSFYGQEHIAKADVTVPYLTGFADWADFHAGTHTAPEMYGWTNNGASWGARTFDVCLWEIARLRNCRKSKPGTPVAPWIAYADYTAPSLTRTGFEHTREKVYHCYLAGCSRVLYFNPLPPFGGTAAADDYMQEIVADVQERFGSREVTPLSNNDIPTASTHNNEWFMSGAKVGAEYLWRITCSEKVKVIRVSGVGQPRAAGVFGVWVKTSTAAPPTVTVDLENGPL